MAKKDTLQEVTRLASEGSLTEEELLTAYRLGKPQPTLPTNRLNIEHILYYTGGAIVVLGISILVAQNWEALTTATRILATLGASLAAYIVGVLFGRYRHLFGVSQAFYLISGILAPIGLSVTFHELNLDTSHLSIQTAIAAILFSVYLTLLAIHRQTIFVVFSIIFGTWLFFSGTSWLAENRAAFDDFTFVSYRFLFAGLSYIFLGYSFAQQKKAVLSQTLYSFGIIAFLGAALALGGWNPNQNLFWELIFPGLALGTMFLSLHLKSRSFLIFGALYLMGYILKITAEYFSDTLGWSLALVIAGFALMGIGYGTFYLNQKYLGKKS